MRNIMWRIMSLLSKFQLYSTFVNVCCMYWYIILNHITRSHYIEGLVQDCSNSSMLAIELLKSCTKLLIHLSSLWGELNNVSLEEGITKLCFYLGKKLLSTETLANNGIYIWSAEPQRVGLGNYRVDRPFVYRIELAVGTKMVGTHLGLR